MAGAPKNQPAPKKPQAAFTADENAPEVTDPEVIRQMRLQREQAEQDRLNQEGYKKATGGKAKGGAVKKMARGGGIEKRGKTRGRIR